MTSRHRRRNARSRPSATIRARSSGSGRRAGRPTASITPTDDDPRPKWYALTMLPYTSGDLHIGHWYAMAPSDAAARFKRMNGYNVLFPMGFDAFGLPAENAAIKNQHPPGRVDLANIERMRGQLKSMGAMFDWRREVITASPDYYKWTQWWFLKLLKHDLAYRKNASVWWCPKDQTVLANEQVVDGTLRALRHRRREARPRAVVLPHHQLRRRAARLLEACEWPEQIQSMQRNWIGRSEGAELRFGLDVPGVDEKEIRVFTTRPDTVYGVTFFVLAPEHPLVEHITTPDAARRRRGLRRCRAPRVRDRTHCRPSARRPASSPAPTSPTPSTASGCPSGSPTTCSRRTAPAPSWACPAHDQRDFEFARKYGLQIIPRLQPPGLGLAAR